MTGTIRVRLYDEASQKALRGGELTIYRVAEVQRKNGDLSFEYCGDFYGCGIELGDLNDQLEQANKSVEDKTQTLKDAKAKQEKVKLLQAQIQMVQAQISAIQRARQQEQQEVQSRKAEAASAQRRTTERQDSSLGSQVDAFA